MAVPVRTSLRTSFDITNYHFQHERFKAIGCKNMSTIDFWHKKQKVVEEYAKRMNVDLFGALVYLAKTPAHFRCATAMKVYKMFPSVTTIFDPFAGWGDRLLAAHKSGLNYIGSDNNEDLLAPMTAMMKQVDAKTCKFSVCDFSDLKVEVTSGSFLCFTSPPFFNEKHKLVEEYKNCTNTLTKYKDFLPKLELFIAECLDANMRVVLHIPTNMAKDLSELFIVEKLMKYNKRENIYQLKNL